MKRKTVVALLLLFCLCCPFRIFAAPTEVTLTFWDWQVYPTYQQYSDEMVKAYNASQNKVKLIVNREAIGFLDYKPKFQAAASAGNLPDMYQVWLGMDIIEFTEAGLLYDFTDDIKKDRDWNDWYEYLWDNAENQDADGRVRGIPADQFVLGVAYFKDMLNQINGGVKPVTVDEAIKLIPAAKQKGKFLYCNRFPVDLDALLCLGDPESKPMTNRARRLC